MFFSLSLTDGNMVRFYVPAVGGDCASTTLTLVGKTEPKISPKDGNWHHLAGVYANNSIHTYYDGEHMLSLTCGGYAMSFNTVPQRVGLGTGDWGSFHGDLEE